MAPGPRAHYSGKESIMPTPAYLSLEGTKQGLITAGTFTEDSVGNIF